MKSPIFIVGPHRSGSTVWHNLVSMNSGIMRLTDPRFLSSPRHKDFKFFVMSQGGDLSIDSNVERMVDLTFNKTGTPGLDGTFWRFEGIPASDDPRLRVKISQKIIDSDRSLGSIARIYIDEITRHSGYDRACIKFPADVEYISELMNWFPDCLIMHITRDPRALAMSKTNDPSGTAIRVLEHPKAAWLIRKATIAHVIAQYRRYSKIHSEFERYPNYKLFRYEDLLANSTTTAKSLCDFIGVDFDPKILNLENSRHEHQPSSITGHREKKLKPSAAIRWKTAMPKSDQWIVSALCKRSMARFEYNPNIHPIFDIQ
jgi:hypothetical protein